METRNFKVSLGTVDTSDVGIGHLFFHSIESGLLCGYISLEDGDEFFVPTLNHEGREEMRKYYREYKKAIHSV